MSMQLRTNWMIDGVAICRNPSDYSIKYDKVNASYEKQADGSQRRVQAPKLLTSGDITLTWKYAPRRVLRQILQYCNQRYPLPGQSHSILIDGIQPPMQVNGWFDTPAVEMSKDIYTTKTGEGGHFLDITLTVRMDGRGLQSYYTVPSSQTPVASSVVASQFGGVIGNALDYLPQWNGQAWNQPMASHGNYQISNLGNQEWFPQIIFNGPFASCTLVAFSADVDGTGNGVEFNWTGSTIASTMQVAFNTQSMRCFLLASGQLPVEVYTFQVNTHFDHNPFGFWPGMLVGLNNFSSTASGLGPGSYVDWSNGGIERFSYYG